MGKFGKLVAAGKSEGFSANKTYAEALCFSDDDLTTPMHDKIVLWAMEKIPKMCGYCFPMEVYRNIEKRDSACKLELEFPIVKTQKGYNYENKHTVGFADVRATYDVRHFLSTVGIAEANDNEKEEARRWNLSKVKVYSQGDFWSSTHIAYFEIKSKIPSLGDLVRQIRFYAQYTGDSPWFVISPDTRYKTAIESQDIGFILYPDAGASS